MKKKITVVGATNSDIRGECLHSIVWNDSNIGRISSTLGGVGHNIALNIARLGEEVTFITALGSDAFGKDAIREMESCLDITHALFSSSPSGVYLYVTDDSGDMKVAVNDMTINDEITPEFIFSKRNIIEESDFLILEANIPEETILCASKITKGIVIADSVSTLKANRLRPSFPFIDILKPNIMELEFLSGVKICDKETLREASDIILEKGVGALLVTAGSNGSYYVDKNRILHAGVLKGEIKNTNGAGDAFLGAFVSSLAKDKTVENSLCLASAAAGVCSLSGNTVSEEINWSLIQNKSKEIEIEEIS